MCSLHQVLYRPATKCPLVLITNDPGVWSIANGAEQPNLLPFHFLLLPTDNVQSGRLAQPLKLVIKIFYDSLENTHFVLERKDQRFKVSFVFSVGHVAKSARKP